MTTAKTLHARNHLGFTTLCEKDARRARTTADKAAVTCAACKRALKAQEAHHARP